MIVLWMVGILNSYLDFWRVEVVLIAVFLTLTLALLIFTGKKAFLE